MEELSIILQFLFAKSPHGDLEGQITVKKQSTPDVMI